MPGGSLTHCCQAWSQREGEDRSVSVRGKEAGDLFGDFQNSLTIKS